MKLSVVVPVYNERALLPKMLAHAARALPGVPKEFILVDDGSKDGTREWLRETFGACDLNPTGIQVQGDAVRSVTTADDTIRVIFHERNRGKGGALRTGFQHVTGDVVLIQDADLEYDPGDWAKMWRLIDGGWADVVYGSRFSGEPHRVLYFHHFLGNKIISYLINLLCDTTLSDIEVCYKMFRREVLESLKLTCNDFGFEVEFTVKVTKARRWRVYETGISYYGRTYAEGKKINWKDGLKALWYILKFRMVG